MGGKLLASNWQMVGKKLTKPQKVVWGGLKAPSTLQPLCHKVSTSQSQYKLAMNKPYLLHAIWGILVYTRDTGTQ